MALAAAQEALSAPETQHLQRAAPAARILPCHACEAWMGVGSASVRLYVIGRPDRQSAWGLVESVH